ncbi:MAG: hypothetical protein ACE5OZ_11045 [Candidatus Heimdallarchaeota archaeon]
MLGNVALALFLAINLTSYSVSQASEPNQQLLLTEIGQISTPGFARDVLVSGDTAYVADLGTPDGTAGGFLTININDPSNPVKMGEFFDGGRGHTLFVEEDIIFIAVNFSRMPLAKVPVH